MFNFTLAESDRGLRISRGLANLSSQSVPVNRIQGVRISRPLLWLPLGWYRVDIVILGYVSSDEGDNDQSSTVLLPVATKDEVELALDRILPGVDLDAVADDDGTPTRGLDPAVRLLDPEGRHGRPRPRHRDGVVHQRPQRRPARQEPVRPPQPGAVAASAAAGRRPRRHHQGTGAGGRVPDGRRPCPTAGDVPARPCAGGAPDRSRAVAAGCPTSGREQAILDHFAVERAALLGRGGEANVYALDDARVLRIYHSSHEGPAHVIAQLAGAVPALGRRARSRSRPCSRTASGQAGSTR